MIKVYMEHEDIIYELVRGSCPDCPLSQFRNIKYCQLHKDRECDGPYSLGVAFSSNGDPDNQCWRLFHDGS